jgi:hypothetical protein
MSQIRPDNQDEWQNFRDPDTGKLLFKFNRERRMIEVGSRGILRRVDVEELMRRGHTLDKDKDK